jgi:hypothetical protein
MGTSEADRGDAIGSSEVNGMPNSRVLVRIECLGHEVLREDPA